MNPKPVSAVNSIVNSLVEKIRKEKESANKKEALLTENKLLQQVSIPIEEENKEVYTVKESMTEKSIPKLLTQTKEGIPQIEEINIKERGLKKEKVLKERHTKVQKEINWKAPSNLVTKYFIENPNITAQQAKEKLIQELGDCVKDFSNTTINSQISITKLILRILEAVKAKE